MSEIYIVTTGTYSEYSICGVFTDKDAAEEFRYYHNYDSVEVWDVDEEVPKFSRDRTPWRVFVDLGTLKAKATRESFEDYVREMPYITPMYRNETEVSKATMGLTAIAAGEESAAKIGMETARAFIAGQTTAKLERRMECVLVFPTGAIRESALYYDAVVRAVDNRFVDESSNLEEMTARYEKEGIEVVFE